MKLRWLWPVPGRELFAILVFGCIVMDTLPSLKKGEFVIASIWCKKAHGVASSITGRRHNGIKPEGIVFPPKIVDLHKFTIGNTTCRDSNDTLTPLNMYSASVSSSSWSHRPSMSRCCIIDAFCCRFFVSPKRLAHPWRGWKTEFNKVNGVSPRMVTFFRALSMTFEFPGSHDLAG